MLPARRASYAILKFVMESGAKGCQIVISGKLRGQRAKAAKFRDGYMVKSGQTSRGECLPLCFGQVPACTGRDGMRACAQSGVAALCLCCVSHLRALHPVGFWLLHGQVSGVTWRCG